MPRKLRPLLAGACVLLLLLPGCSVPLLGGDEDGDPGPGPASTGQAAPGVSGGPPRWRDCPEVPKKLVGRGAEGMTYQCATIRVPRDWAAPAGGTLEVALLRARSAKQSRRIGSLLLNPGGPGSSGIDTAVYLSFGPRFGGLSDAVTSRFDLVGFDPRGVGRSSPVKCVPDADFDAYFGADQDPVSEADFAALAALNKRIGAACAAKLGPGGPATFATERAARDMDAVRAAVGDQKLTYLGYSYGTLLGATYAQLFPQRVRALVLDGAVDPRADAIVGSENQARGFEKAFGTFAAWCRRTPKDCAVAPDARAALTAALDRARRSPVRGAGDRRATAGWIFWATVSSLYTRTGCSELATALDRLAGGDPKKVFELADRYVEREPSGRYANMFDAFLTVGCADSEQRVSVARVRQLQGQWRAAYPLFGPALATGLLTCSSWPGARDPYPTGEAVGAPPIVVVGTTGDPATPYEQTAKLADMLGVGRVLTWEGEGHTAYPETPCVTRAVDSYLVDLTVPAPGLRCPARG
ncbi:MAG TPA: alpha/beta hydrolase [Pilimelia sp.]|nr:alpha/beta hydrolase [Pilimelia sp.]